MCVRISGLTRVILLSHMVSRIAVKGSGLTRGETGGGGGQFVGVNPNPRRVSGVVTRR